MSLKETQNNYSETENDYKDTQNNYNETENDYKDTQNDYRRDVKLPQSSDTDGNKKDFQQQVKSSIPKRHLIKRSENYSKECYHKKRDGTLENECQLGM